MKSIKFIKKIKVYSVIVFLLPLLTINSCLLLYKILGNIDVYSAWGWNEKKIEIKVLQNSSIFKIHSSVSLIESLIDCPKYKYQEYLLTVDNILIEYGSLPSDTVDESNPDKETMEKVKILIKNNKIKSIIYKRGEDINYRCVKNHKYL